MQSKGLSKVFSSTTSSSLSFLYSLTVTSIHDHWKKTIALTRWTFVGKVMSLRLNMLSRLVITFLPRSKRLLISWLQSPSAVILEPAKIKSTTVSPSICIFTTNKGNGSDAIPVELFQILKDDAVKVLHSICQQIWKTQQWPQDWKRSVFIPVPKKGNSKE